MATATAGSSVHYFFHVLSSVFFAVWHLYGLEEAFLPFTRRGVGQNRT